MAFPTNPSDGDFHLESGKTWIYVSPPGVWTIAGGTPISVDESDPVFTASDAAGYTEAPQDGTPYSRQDGGWVAAAAAVNSINDIGDVDTTGVVGGDVLKYNGSVWTPTVDDDTDALADLTDTTLTSPANGEFLQYNGAAWVNATAPAGYTDADVDNRLNTGTATTGEVLSWTGADYDWIAAGGSYGDADVDTHLNTSTATANQILSWTGSDYAWTDDQTGGGGATGTPPELLLKGDVSVTQDDSLNGYTFTTTGTAPTVNTSDKQFGAGSMSFPTTTKITTNETINFGAQTFCIEAWLKPTTVTGTQYWGSKPPTGAFCWLLVANGKPGISYAGATRSATSSLSTSAWNHVAFVFDGTNINVYFNGTQELTALASADLGDFVWAFGGTDSGVAGSGSWYNGLIDDLRITLGDPVYTANFTPAEHSIPVAKPLGEDETDVIITSPSNGQVLQYNGTNWVNAAGGDKTAENGWVGKGTTGPSGVPIILDDVEFDTKAGDWTFEFAFNVELDSTFRQLFAIGGDGTTNTKGDYWCYKTSTNGLQLIRTSDGTGTTGTNVLNSLTTDFQEGWNTLLMVRSGTNLTVWLNGIRKFTGAEPASTASTTGGKLALFGHPDNTATFGGIDVAIAGYRYNAGTAEYLNTQNPILATPIQKTNPGVANTASGVNAFYLGDTVGNASGSNATAIGLSAEAGGTSTVVGYDAGSTTMTSTVAMGYKAGDQFTTSNATFIGYTCGAYTGLNTAITGVGYAATAQNVGAGAVGVGYQALNLNAGQYAVGIGYQAGNSAMPANAVAINATGAGLVPGAAGDIAITTTTAEIAYDDAVGFEFTNDRDATAQTAIINPDTGVYVFPNLPTADPVNAGQLWNDAGTLKVSAG